MKTIVICDIVDNPQEEIPSTTGNEELSRGIHPAVLKHYSFASGNISQSCNTPSGVCLIWNDSTVLYDANKKE